MVYFSKIIIWINSNIERREGVEEGDIIFPSTTLEGANTSNNILYRFLIDLGEVIRIYRKVLLWKYEKAASLLSTHDPFPIFYFWEGVIRTLYTSFYHILFNFFNIDLLLYTLDLFICFIRLCFFICLNLCIYLF